MILILDFSQGRKYEFRTRKAAAFFLGISQPTLRKYLAPPFYLIGKYVLISIDGTKKKRAIQTAIQERKKLLQYVSESGNGEDSH